MDYLNEFQFIFKFRQNCLHMEAPPKFQVFIMQSFIADVSECVSLRTSAALPAGSAPVIDVHTWTKENGL